MAYITLNKSNFFHNLDTITNHTKSKEKIGLVLKDNAYGHGIKEMAKMAVEYGISKAIVRCDIEAKMIKDMFDYILVLSDMPLHPSEKIRYTINDLTSIKRFPKGTRVELKVDTGMHRNGVDIDEVFEAIELIDNHGLRLEGVFTHHRSADVLSGEWFWQNENFKKVKSLLKDMKDLRFHSANSASLFRTKNFDEDMARVGIAAYGCMDKSDVYDIKDLKPVLSLYATKNSSRKLKDGDMVGYSAVGKITQECTLSNYDFGYGDGFLRACSNDFATPDGAKLIGRISMDNSSFMTDKDELLIFDDAREVAKSANTISYEVLTSLKPYIQRIIV